MDFLFAFDCIYSSVVYFKDCILVQYLRSGQQLHLSVYLYGLVAVVGCFADSDGDCYCEAQSEYCANDTWGRTED